MVPQGIVVSCVVILLFSWCFSCMLYNTLSQFLDNVGTDLQYNSVTNTSPKR